MFGVVEGHRNLWMPYASVGSDNYVRAKYFVYAAGQQNPAQGNTIPNMRMRISLRFAVNSMLEVFNHLNSDPQIEPLSQELRPSADPATRWVDAFVLYLGNECHLSANTGLAYTRDLKAFEQWLAGRPVSRLTIRDLSDYAAWLHGQKRAPASVARNLVAVKMYFRYLQLEGVLRDNLMELLGSQKLWHRVPQVLTVGQVD